jgi:hypothetical protein
VIEFHSVITQLTILTAITTYEQALNWLGANEELDDSFITALYANKVRSHSVISALAGKRYLIDCSD